MQTLIGKNGAMVGSAIYFQKLNEPTAIGDLMRSYYNTANSTNYAGLYDKLKASADAAVEEIFWDLKKYIAVMRYFPKCNRETLIAVVKALDELKGFGSRGLISKANACIDILTLKSYDTKPKSRASQKDIEAAAKRASQKSSNSLELIKRASEYGITRAAGSDSWKLSFLHDTIGPYSQDFYKDLYIYMNFQKNHRHMTGRCHKELCTPEYISAIEQKVFGKAAGWFDDCDSYFKVFRDGLKEIAATLETDLNLPVQGVQTEYQETLNSVAGQLDKLLGTKLKNKVATKHLMYKEPSDRAAVDKSSLPVSRDYIYLNQVDYYFENERDYGEDHFFAEIDGKRYPANSMETVTKYDWYAIDTEFLTKTLDRLVDEANKKETDLSRIMKESLSTYDSQGYPTHRGELDFKTHLDQQILYLVNGVLYNRNEAGNFVWAYFLESQGYYPAISGTLAQGGSLKDNWTQYHIIRGDEPGDYNARWAGTKYYYARRGEMDKYRALYGFTFYKP